MTKDKILSLRYGTRDMTVELEYAFRKRLSLHVLPSQRIIAKIPYGLSQKDVLRFLHKKSAWIDKHLRYYESHPPEKPRQYIENETHRYLGKPYNLKLGYAPVPRILCDEGKLCVLIKEPDDPEKVRAVLDRWYRNEAVRLLSSRFHILVKEMENRLDLPVHTLRFYKMKRRWGSCSSRGVITLNTELIKQDQRSIDYVIIHELCHLKVPAHNKTFYTLLESILPDWKKCRETLNTYTLL